MKTFYLDIDNSWDAERAAETELEAVAKLFPGAPLIRYVGVDDYDGGAAAVYEVADGGEQFEVYVVEKF